MFSFVLFALLSVAGANPLSSYAGYGGYGGYAGSAVAPKYGAQAYGVHQKVEAPVGYSGAVHAAPVDQYARDYNIEQFGEKYAYQNAPGASFQYSFLRGADLPSHSGVAAYGVPAVHSGVAAYGVPAVHSGVASFGVPHEQRFSEPVGQYGVNQYAGVVAPVNSYGHLKATHGVHGVQNYY